MDRIGKYKKYLFAAVGSVLAVLFLILSLGSSWFTSCSIDQIFYKTKIKKDAFAQTVTRKDFQVISAEGETLPGDILLAINQGKKIYESKRTGEMIGIRSLSKQMYILYHLENSTDRKVKFSEEREEAEKRKESFFEREGILYMIEGRGNKAVIYTTDEIGLVCSLYFVPYEEKLSLPYEFLSAALYSICEGIDGFEAEGETFSLDTEKEDFILVYDENGEDYACITNRQVRASESRIPISSGFKWSFIGSIKQGEKEFSFGEEDFIISLKEEEYIIKKKRTVQTVDRYAAPSDTHILGTDENGVDVLAKVLMGTRVSAWICLVTLLLRSFWGILFGAMAKRFGGQIGEVLISVTDVMEDIPDIPLYIFLGCVAAFFPVSSAAKPYLLAVLLSADGWTQITRTVYREYGRKDWKNTIYRKLPDWLIWFCRGFGDLLLLETVFAFLGLGIRNPGISLGSIIRIAVNIKNLTGHTNIWLPAFGILILSVAGWNLLAEGLNGLYHKEERK